MGVDTRHAEAYYRTMLGNRVRNLRRERGMTQAELASAAGVRNATVSNIEVGQRSIRLLTAQKLAHALGVTVSDLVKE